MIYFVQCGCGCGSIKIGSAERPKARVREMQTGCAHRLHLLGSLMFVGDSYEYRLHRRFWRERLIGEWFDKSIREHVDALLLVPVREQNLAVRTLLKATPKELEQRRCGKCGNVYTRYGKYRGSHQSRCPECKAPWGASENLQSAP